MDTLDVLHLCANGFSALTFTLLLIGTLLGGDWQRKTNRWFTFCMVSTLLGVIAEFMIGLLLSTGGSTVNTVIRIVDYFGYLMGGVQIFAFTGYIYSYLGTKVKLSKTPRNIMISCGVISMVLATIAQFNDIYAIIDENNLYHQQDTYWISLTCLLLFQLTYLYLILKHRKKLRTKEWISLLSHVFIYFAAYFVTWKKPDLWLTYPAIAVSSFLIYVNIQIDVLRQLAEQQAQLDESRIAIMLSQIQPHFLYNSLTAISGQCADNPQAQKSILSFSQYLRGNMDSLSQKTPIPFADELAHTQQYLELEQLRFGQKLDVMYDVQITEFMLPVLTLQPIVENAVRHGIHKKKNGGTVTIRTEEQAHCYCIRVEDDGVGFDPAASPQDGRSHIGIENVRSRLDAMCGGTLVVESAPGIGTTARLTVPKKGGAR